MKNLTDELYFDVSDLSSTLNTQINYSLEVVDNDGNILVSYSGRLFYYDAAQRIYYDFLLENIHNNFTQTNTVYLQSIIPSVTVNAKVGNTTKATEDVLLIEKSMPVDNTSITLTDEVENPEVVLNQTYPITVIVKDTNNLTGGEYIEFDGLATPITITESKNVFMNVSSIPTNVHLVSESEYNLELQDTKLCADYMLMWYDNRGFWQSKPFAVRKEFTSENNEITNLRNVTRKYNTVVENRYFLTSGFVREYKTYTSLFTSKSIYLYDIQEDKYIKVLITDNTFQENKSRKPFKFELNLKEDKKYISK